MHEHRTRAAEIAVKIREAMMPLVNAKDEYLDIHGMDADEEGERIYEAADALDRAFDHVDSCLRSLELEDAYDDEVEPVRHMIVRADGTDTVDVAPLPLKAMQRIVGGWIEALPHNLGEDLALFCNEEGKIEDLPINARITALVADALDPADLALGGIRGDVLAVGFNPDAGENADLTDEHIAVLTKENQ